MLKSFTPVVVMVFLFLFDIEVPYQHTLSTHLTNQHTLSTYPINTSYQHTLSTHPINTPYQHTLSTYPINTSYQPCQLTFSWYFCSSLISRYLPIQDINTLSMTPYHHPLLSPAHDSHWLTNLPSSTDSATNPSIHSHPPTHLLTHDTRPPLGRWSRRS